MLWPQLTIAKSDIALDAVLREIVSPYYVLGIFLKIETNTLNEKTRITHRPHAVSLG